MLVIALLLAAAASAEFTATVEKVTVNTPDAAKPAETADAAERRQAALKTKEETDAGNPAVNADTAERRQAELEEKTEEEADTAERRQADLEEKKESAATLEVDREQEEDRREMNEEMKEEMKEEMDELIEFTENKISKLEDEVKKECQDCSLPNCLIVEQGTTDFGGLTVSHLMEGNQIQFEENMDKKKICVKPYPWELLKNQQDSNGYIPKNVSEKCGATNTVTGPSIFFMRTRLSNWVSVFESTESCCLAYKATYQFFKKVYPEKDEKAVAEVDRMRFDKGTKTKLKGASCGDLEELTTKDEQTREELAKISGKVDAFQKILEKAPKENAASFGEEGYFRHAVNFMKSFRPDAVVENWMDKKKGQFSELSTAYVLPGKIGCAGAGSYGVIFDPSDTKTEILLAAPEDVGLTSQEMPFEKKIEFSVYKLSDSTLWKNEFFVEAKKYASLKNLEDLEELCTFVDFSKLGERKKCEVTFVDFSTLKERKKILNVLKLQNKMFSHNEVVINTNVSKIAGVFVDEKAADEVGYKALELKQLLVQALKDQGKQNTDVPFYLVAKDGTLKGVQL